MKHAIKLATGLFSLIFAATAALAFVFTPVPVNFRSGYTPPASCTETNYSSDVLCISTLVGYWRATDGAGSSIFADSARTPHNATKTAGVTFGSTSLVTGSSATSALFNGSNGYGILDATGEAFFHNWNYNQPWTVEAIIRPNFSRSANGQYAIFSKLQSSGNYTGIEVCAEYNTLWGITRLRVYIISVFGTYHIEVIGNSDLTNGVNHHIVASYNGNGAASGVTMYVDGVLQSNAVVSDSLSGQSIVNSVAPNIGARNTSSLFFNGNIQELAVYTGAAQQTASLIKSNVYSPGKPYYHYGLSLGRSPVVNIPTPRLILDTDLASDVDDAGDLAMALALSLRGEAALVGVITNSANDRSADTAYAISKYMIPSTTQSFVGAWQGSVPSGSPSNSLYTADISATFGANQGRASYADAISKYRALLNSQPNGSVVIVATGFSTTLNGLLTSAANYGGDGLGTGTSIISAKVARLVLVMGCYPVDTVCATWDSPEFNFVNGPAASASNLVATWPAEIVAIGIELGGQGGTTIGNVYAGPATTSVSSTNPVQQAFHDWGSTPRTAWGMLGVLYAVRGTASGVEIAGLRGTNTVNSSTGANTWTATSGNYSWTRLSAVPSAFNALFNSVYTALPKPF